MFRLPALFVTGINNVAFIKIKPVSWFFMINALIEMCSFYYNEYCKYEKNNYKKYCHYYMIFLQQAAQSYYLNLSVIIH